MATVMWGNDDAANYDNGLGDRGRPEVVDETVTVLHELAGAGAALEFAIGTGRIALPLADRGVRVTGIELSPHMIAQLRAKDGGADLPVTTGDMSSIRVGGHFSLVYLVYNTIMNVTTQDEQVAIFENAARHLDAGGRFVVEVLMPLPHRAPGAVNGNVFNLSGDRVGVETHDDPIAQIASSHHWYNVDGQLRHAAAPYRYVWPAELDLMARVAGLEFESRWADWDRSEFTAISEGHVSVWRKP